MVGDDALALLEDLHRKFWQAAAASDGWRGAAAASAAAESGGEEDATQPQRVDVALCELRSAMPDVPAMELTARVPAKLLHGSADDAPPSNLGVACDDVTHLSAGGGDLVALVVDQRARASSSCSSPSPTILQRVLYSSKVRLVALQAPSKDRVELVALCVDGSLHKLALRTRGSSSLGRAASDPDRRRAADAAGVRRRARDRGVGRRPLYLGRRRARRARPRRRRRPRGADGARAAAAATAGASARWRRAAARRRSSPCGRAAAATPRRSSPPSSAGAPASTWATRPPPQRTSSRCARAA